MGEDLHIIHHFYMTSFTNYVAVYSIILYTIGSVSVFVNLLGGYCILFQTPEYMRSVKFNLLNYLFWSFSLDIVIGVLHQPFLCDANHGTNIGLIRFLNLDVTAQANISLTVFFVVGVAIVSIFESRFHALSAHEFWWTYFRYPFLVSNYLMTLSGISTHFLGITEQISSSEEMFEKLPELKLFDNPNHPLIVSYMEYSFLLTVRAIVPIFIIILEALLFFVLIRRRLNAFKTVSSWPINMQKTLIRAIYLQISIPMLILMIPGFIVIVIRVILARPEQINNFAFMIMSAHGLTGTVIMLYIHKPYRSFCMSWF